MSETEHKPIGWVFQRAVWALGWDLGWEWQVSETEPNGRAHVRAVTPIYPPAPKLSPEVEAAQRKAVADVLRILDGYPTAEDRDGVPITFGQLRDLVGRPRIGEREPRYDFAHTAPDGQEYVDANVELVAKALHTTDANSSLSWARLIEAQREVWRDKAREMLDRLSGKR